MKRFKHPTKVGEAVMAAQLLQIFKLGTQNISASTVSGACKLVCDSGRCAMPNLSGARAVHERIPLRTQIFDAKPRDMLSMLCQETPEQLMIIPDLVLPGASALHFVMGTEDPNRVNWWWNYASQNHSAQLFAAEHRGLIMIASPIRCFTK